MIIKLRCDEGLIVGKTQLLPLLQVIEKYPFPKPIHCSRTNPKLIWLNGKINSFTGEKFLKYLDPTKRNLGMHIVSVDENSNLHLNLSIAQKEDSVLLMTNVKSFLTAQQAKQFFIELVQCDERWSQGYCTNDIFELIEKHFTDDERRTKTLLNWLQYFGREELEWRGGFPAFELNPHVKTQRIHDGLLVQVGDSPDVFDTPQGEILLVNAINALPLVKQ